MFIFWRRGISINSKKHREEREECTYALLGIRDEIPELFTLNLLLATWEAFSYDYVSKMFEGARKIGQFCRPSGDIVEIRRLSLNKHPDGGIIWRPPLSFCMKSSRGYWRSNIIPRLDDGVVRQGYALALEKIAGKAKPQKFESKVGAGVPEGGDATRRLFPLGEKIPRSETNAALQNVPRKAQSGVALRLDFDAHSGFHRGNACRFCHEYFGGGNLHWCAEAELIRRDGYRKRKNMANEAKEAIVLIEELREQNRMVMGEQILESKSAMPER